MKAREEEGKAEPGRELLPLRTAAGALGRRPRQPPEHAAAGGCHPGAQTGHQSLVPLKHPCVRENTQFSLKEG